MASNEKKTLKKQLTDKHMRWYHSIPLKQNATDYAEFYNKLSVDSKLVVYEAFFGRGVLCNVHGVFAAFMAREDFSQYQHVWVLEDMQGNEPIIKEYEKYSNVKFVEYLSKEYLKVIASAKILVNNVTFPSFFTKKKEQIYINTWHGIPLKTLGYDQVNGNLEVANTVRNFLATDYLLSPCPYQTEIYKKAFKLDGIFTGTIIEEGQPRNDFSVKYDREEILERMRRNGVRVDSNKKIVLYAPTWKGKNYGMPTLDIEGYYEFIATLEKQLPEDEYQVLVKPHQVVYQHIKDDKRVSDQFVPATLDANEILAVTDVLVSDYSSIYFDYMVTDRPILFYIPDIDDYKDYRGLYLPMEDLPGPASKDLNQIPKWINDINAVQKDFAHKYKEQKERFVPFDRGDSGKRVLDIVLDQNKNFNGVEGLVTSKKKILAYIGATKVNGITESFNSLLNMLDYDKFDMTVIAMPSKVPNEIEKLCSINPKARVLTKVGYANATVEEAVNNELVQEYSLDDEDIDKFYSDAFYAKEYRRNFGDAAFDYVVNFTGYSSYYSVLLLQTPNTEKYIWLHNDLLKDQHRLVNGEKINEKPLGTVFSTYPQYDKLVSCSESVMYVNRDSLATKETYDKYTYCRNLVNFQRVFDGVAEDKVLREQDESHYMKQQQDSDGSQFIRCNAVPLPGKDKVSFVTMGRMSPEKNHENLIRAFARFNRQYPNTMLYVLGDGPLMDQLQVLIREEGCRDSVGLLGNVLNPFAFMKHCDCFILPSNYEGQPMVLLEARAMDLPIIVADFSTVTDSLIDGGQLLIKQDVESIYDSFVAFMDGKVPFKKFDYEQYNRNSYKEFERLFD